MLKQLEISGVGSPSSVNLPNTTAPHFQGGFEVKLISDKFGINIAKCRTLLMNCITACLSTGSGISCIPPIFSRSDRTPPAVNRWLSYVSWVRWILHVSQFSFKFFSSAMHSTPSSPSSNAVIAFWKTSGAEEIPNGSRLSRYLPNEVLKGHN